MVQKVGETKEDVFNDLLKKYESAARDREWKNTARGNEYDRNVSHLEGELKVFKKRYEAAPAE